MIIIQQDFNKVPLCLEGTKENSPFAVSGPALVFVVVSGITPGFFLEKWKWLIYRKMIRIKCRLGSGLG